MIHLTVCLLSLHCIYKIIAIHAAIHRLTQANTTACFFTPLISDLESILRGQVRKLKYTFVRMSNRTNLKL